MTYAKKRVAGGCAEAVVRGMLEARGYVVIAKNFYAGHYEIDIIAENADFICFVEVKARQSGFCGDVTKYVTAAQMRRVTAAAERFCSDNNIDKAVRFDIALVPLRGGIADRPKYAAAAFCAEDFA